MHKGAVLAPFCTHPLGPPGARGTPERSAGGRADILAPVDLEERTLENVGDRCEECGAPLTADEMRAVLESGGPALCKIHAAEEVPVDDEAPEFES